MYCRNCGAEIGDAKFCPHCGAQQGAPANESIDVSLHETGSGYTDSSVLRPFESETEDRFRRIFKDPLYLVICILMSVSTVLAVFGGAHTTNVTVNGVTVTSIGGISILGAVFPVLFVIALWLTFAAARNKERFSGTGLAIASGTVKAAYIVAWVAVGILVLGAIAMLLLGPAIASVIPVDGIFNQSSFGGGIDQPPINIDGMPFDIDELPFDLNEIINPSTVQYVMIGFAVAMLLLAVVLVIVNVFYYRNLHKFTKSVCVSLESGRYEIAKANTVRKWMMVLGIISAVGFVFGIFSLANLVAAASSAANVCSAAAQILSSVMIKKYFVDEA